MTSSIETVMLKNTHVNSLLDKKIYYLLEKFNYIENLEEIINILFNFIGTRIEVKCGASNNKDGLIIEGGNQVRFENLRFQIYERSLCGNTGQISVITIIENESAISPEE